MIHDLFNVLFRDFFEYKMSCPFKILQIPRHSTRLEIKKAYISKVKQYHPDRARLLSKSEQIRSKQLFLQVQEAYQMLNSGKIISENINGKPRNYPSSGTYSKERQQMDAYWKRREKYARTGEGENKPIYGPNTLVMLGVLGVAILIGGVTFQQKLHFLKQKRIV
jgi:hypothetical protein